MPTPFTVIDPETGEAREVPHFRIEEVAAMFGMSKSAARKRVKEGEWTVWEPIHGSYWMTPEHIAEARERAIHRARPPAPECPEAPDPPRLGVPVNPADLEGME